MSDIDCRLRIAELNYKHQCELADANLHCCKVRISGNERVINQMEINNKQASGCCNLLSDADYCCCKNR